MKILLIDASSFFLDFAMRCEAEGHEVRIFLGKLKDGSHSPVGKGLLNVIRDWREHMKWADLILTSDNLKYIKELEVWRTRGFPLYGPNVEGVSWELDRGTGQRIFEDHGIPTIPSIVFSNYEDGIAHLQKDTSKRYVCKPVGDATKDMSYVAKDCRDLAFMLEHWKKTVKKAPYLFQEFIPGIEMAVGGWMGRDGFLSYFLENFEFKKLMPGDYGCNTGEMGTVMKYVKAECSLLAQKVLLPLEAALIRMGYTGYIDVAVIIDEKGEPRPLELTSRMGWPLFQIQQSLHSDPVEWMKASLDGVDTFEPYGDVAVGIVVAIPDFPYSKAPASSATGFPVWGITEKNRYNFHPAEMQLGTAPELVNGKLTQKPMLVSCGNYVFIVSGNGPGVNTASQCAYKNLDDFIVPNSPIVRNDIGQRLQKQLPKLQALGYATQWEW